MRSRIIQYVSFFLLWMQFSSCQPYVEEEFAGIGPEAVQDSLFRRIKDFQHLQLPDSLLPYFQHQDPAYRYLAVLAFGSIQDDRFIDTLAYLLRDPVDEVRAVAAYALGQQGSPRAEPMLIQAFARYDTIGVYAEANKAILEAIGKTGSLESLAFLSTTDTYETSDTALLEGQAWGIYRFALRNMTLPEGTRLMLQYATDNEFPEKVRLIASNYLFRARNIVLDSLAANQLARTIFNEEDPRIRMTLAIALGKTKTETALDALVNLYNLEGDYRVKCNIIRAFGNFQYIQAQAHARKALRDPNIHISLRAAQYFLDNGVSEDATLYGRLTRDSFPWQVSTTLYAAALRHLPNYYDDDRVILNGQLRQTFRQSESPFEQVAVLQTLLEWPWNLRFIQREGFQAKHAMVRGAAVQALATLSRNQRQFPGFNSRSIAVELSIYFRQAIESGDPAMMVPAAEALQHSNRNYQTLIDSVGFLERALQKVDPQEDVYTYAALNKALLYLKGDESTPPYTLPLKPIDWSVFAGIAIEPIALITTGQRQIKVKLLPQIAPASVSNFITLAQEGYFNGKYFYRVVPNFVIQGVEAVDYEPVPFAIRSELARVHYTEAGKLGMASSGRHTESTQFFITHSPAPHLDGNYTLFGQVEEGQEYVDQIQVGDRVDNITIR